MPTTSDYDTPNFDDLLGLFLDRIKQQEKPLLIALLERVAAEKYREWAENKTFLSERDQLLECAKREDQIAYKIEQLYSDPKLIQEEITRIVPELEQASGVLFGNKAIPHQMAVLAIGERWGSGVWELLAKAETDSKTQEVLLSCRPLEEANAAVLERILLTN